MQEKQNKTALIWFRNNLRVHDNSIVEKALKNAKNVVALYCFDPRQFEMTEYGFKKTEKFRAKFLIETISDLKRNLSKLNINLLTYFKKPESIIPQLVEEYQIDAIYFQKEWTREEILIVDGMKSLLPSHVTVFDIYDQFLYHPEDIYIDFSNIPHVFSDFRKYVEKNARVRKTVITQNNEYIDISTQNTKFPSLETLGFEDFETDAKSAIPFAGGETTALKRLQHYFFETKNLGIYKKTRNGLIGADFSSKFSPWLANGSISARTIYWEIKRFEKEHFENDSTYWLVFELIWRDYFKYISLKHGNSIFKIGGILNKTYDWSQNLNAISEWQTGQTDEPFVNANMIELNKTGWMSNRGRQNVASYFAKNLELDWRIGASYFESLLIDYDVHSNYGNWMYVSGVGNDPRDRKFNVKLQANRYDEHGTYRHLWLQNTLFE